MADGALRAVPVRSVVSSAERICDLDRLLDRCMGDVGLAAHLLKRFSERLRTVVDEIERGIHRSDWAAVLGRVHSLKGEAASLAAIDLAHAAAQLESCLRAEQWPEASVCATVLGCASDQWSAHCGTLFGLLARRGGGEG
jgi:HPt (histidine-containing phosphotransfer) domain-containing protein